MTERDLAAFQSHPVGRGDYVALVFSGSTEALGELPGYATWTTARKFALADPRLAAEDDFARAASCPFAEWPAEMVRPLPGVCFVLGDEQHPAVKAIMDRDGREFEHLVIASRLTESGLLRHRLEQWLPACAGEPLTLLGFGDQGARIAAVLLSLGVDVARIAVVDDDPARQVAAGNLGLATVDWTSANTRRSAIISSPLRPAERLQDTVRTARRQGRPVFDNSAPADSVPDFVIRGRLWLSTLAHRALAVQNDSISVACHGLRLPVSIIRDEHRQMGSSVVRCLSTCAARTLEAPPGAWIDLSRPDASAPLGHLASGFRRAFVNIAGQTNHHDAAFAILAARAFLQEMYPEAVGAVLPSDRRSAFGASPLERLLPRSATGRSLASPYMTACEQTAIGVLARHFAGSGASGRAIVEIGSALGGSTLLMAAATTGDHAEDGPPIYSIDPDRATRGAMRLAFEEAGQAGRLTQIVETSDQAIARVAHLAGQVGLVFIDGLHTGQASGVDFDLYAPLVAPGGCVAFHDCDARHAGVFRTVVQRAMAARDFTLRCMVDTIAVFERGGGPAA